eukprot:3251480-Pleurochrysis_carterae.AAC.2
MNKTRCGIAHANALMMQSACAARRNMLASLSTHDDFARHCYSSALRARTAKAIMSGAATMALAMSQRSEQLHAGFRP